MIVLAIALAVIGLTALITAPLPAAPKVPTIWAWT